MTKINRPRTSAHLQCSVAIAFAVAAGAMLGLGGCAERLIGSGSATSGSHSSTSNISGKLNITGSSTVAPLLAEIAVRYEKQHAGVRIDVQMGGSSRGIADARRGLADIGMASRALKSEESDLKVYPIAQDGVCLIVHRDNPVAELSDEQIVAIFTGRLKNWREVGGPNQPIVVVSKAAGRATLEVFLKYFQLEADEIAADVIIGDNQHGLKTVVGSPWSIGYVSIGAADFEISRGEPIRLLSIGGIAATTENVAAGKFPISRPLNLVTSGEPSRLARAFIEFAQSSEVIDLVEANYFVPIPR